MKKTLLAFTVLCFSSLASSARADSGRNHETLQSMGLARIDGGMSYSRTVDGKTVSVRLDPQQSRTLMDFVSRMPPPGEAADGVLSQVARRTLEACGRSLIGKTADGTFWFAPDAAGAPRLTADGRRAVPGILLKDPFGGLARNGGNRDWLRLPSSALTGIESRLSQTLAEAQNPNFDGTRRAPAGTGGPTAPTPPAVPRLERNRYSSLSAADVPAAEAGRAKSLMPVRFEKPYKEFHDGNVKVGFLGVEAMGGRISGRNGGGSAWMVAVPLVNAYGLSLKAAHGVMAMTGYDVNTETVLKPDPRAPADMRMVVKSQTHTPRVEFHPLMEATLEPLQLAEAVGLKALRHVRRYVEPFVGADVGYMTIGQTVLTRSSLYLRQNGVEQFMQYVPDETSPTGQPASRLGGALVGGVKIKLTENQGGQIRYLHAPTGFRGVLGGYWINW